MTGKKASEKEASKKAEESKEEIPQEEKVEKKAPEKESIDVSKLSETQRAQLVKDIEQQDIQEHLKKEAQRIKSLSCPVCKARLNLKPEDFMKEGSLSEVVECKKCESLIDVSVYYKASPEISRAKIKPPKSRGYAWETEAPWNWEDKHVIRFAEAEKEKLEKNMSSFTDEGQKLFRIQLFIMKKLKIIK